jgi:murein endopeptidase
VRARTPVPVQLPARHSTKKVVPPPGAPECNYETPLWLHEVLEGQHLGQIAGIYGVRRADLQRWNPELRDPNLIRTGSRLRVCPVIAPRETAVVSYVVQRGDSLEKIAAAYAVTLRELVAMQGTDLRDPNLIRPGQTLAIVQDLGVVAAFRPLEVVEWDDGKLREGVRLPPGAHYHVKRPALAWGRPSTIQLLQRAIERYGAKRPGGPKVFVGDISRERGGEFPPHVSHRSGRDVDVGYVRRGADADNPHFTRVDDRTLDVARTWELLKSILDTHQIQYVFVDYEIQELLYRYAAAQGIGEDTLDELFQYPRGRHRQHGVIRHWRSHADHFHVRFRE